MPVLAGDIVSAATLNNLQSKSYTAPATSNLVGSGTNADVPGATVTLTTLTNNAVYEVAASFDMQFTAGTTALASGGLDIDGAVQTARALWRQAAGALNDRANVAQVYRGTLATAGSHTLKLVATLGSVNHTVGTAHTVINVTITEVV
jgi:hypothetical protein